MVPCDGCKQDVPSVTCYTDSQGGCVELCQQCSGDLLDYLISDMTNEKLKQTLAMWQTEKGTQAPLAPGEAGSVRADQLSTFAMGDGAGKECRVVHDGWVQLYVGIGWIKERQSRQEDYDRFPMVVS